MPSSFNLLAPKQIKTWGPGQFGGSVQLGNAVVISDGFATFIQKRIIGKKNQVIKPHSLRQNKKEAIISSINDQIPMKA